MLSLPKSLKRSLKSFAIIHSLDYVMDREALKKSIEESLSSCNMEHGFIIFFTEEIKNQQYILKTEVLWIQ